jgi:hypothetical protein
MALLFPLKVLHSVYLAIIINDQSVIYLPCPDSNFKRLGQGIIQLRKFI